MGENRVDYLKDSMAELTQACDAIIGGWVRSLELRDLEPKGHTERLAQITFRIARSIGIGEAELAHVNRGAMLHDIGKIGIPDGILMKPDTLSDAEWVIMRQHPVTAFELLSPIGFLRPALDIPYCHHEKWDGTGYPRGLNGKHIPLAARIFALADVYDMLKSDRPYRPAWPEDNALAHIRDQSGKHFDPEVVELFFLLRDSEETPESTKSDTDQGRTRNANPFHRFLT
jgi:response regulator RpfG family c-di-GMP phosphodiesterase